MKKAWFKLDPEHGFQRDEFGGTHVYPDTGRTLAQDAQKGEYRYFQAPMLVAYVFSVACFLKCIASRLLAKHYRRAA